MMDKNKIFLVVFSLIIIAAAFVSYSSSFQNKFVWDDRNFITANPYVHNFSHWQDLLTHNVGYSGGARNNFYRPLYSLLNTLNYKIGNGTEPVFHYTNTFLHAACAVLVLVLINLVFRNVFVAFSTGLLFAVHPVQTQAITYISGRADPMYVMFSLLAVILFIVSGSGEKKGAAYIVSVVSFILALLSKEAALITPFLLLFYIYSLRWEGREERKKLLRNTIPYFAVSGLYLLLRVSVLDFSKSTYSGLALTPGPFYVRALTACKAVFMYLRFLFYPAGFQMETHLTKSKTLFEFPTFAALAGVALLVSVLLYLKKRDRPLFFGLGWFFVGLLPVLNLFPVNAAIAVHWLYLPSIGLFFGASLVLWRFLQVALSGFKPGSNVYLFTVIVLLLGALLGALTYKKNGEWRDEETLYLNVLRYSQTPRVYVNLGNIYARKGEFDKAAKFYKKALEIAPGQTEIYVNLGYIYISEKKNEQALEILTKAVEMSPRHTNAHFNLGVVYANTGRYNEALEEMDKTLELNPNHVQALNVKGQICLRLGKKNEAKDAFGRSLEIRPDQPQIKKILERL